MRYTTAGKSSPPASATAVAGLPLTVTLPAASCTALAAGAFADTFLSKASRRDGTSLTV